MTIPPTAKSELGAVAPAIFSWAFPGGPIRIHVPLDLISRLQTELGQHENSGYSMSGVAAGGVLLGHTSSVATLEIDDYVWVSSMEQPGSRYSLDTSALERLRGEYSARDERAGQSVVVGYFRTQAEYDLQLRDEEVGLVREHFKDPTNVVLLIRTSHKPYTSGFFFWMTEGHFAPFSFLDFPLEAKLLQAKSGHNGATGTQPVEEAETAQLLAADTDDAAEGLAESDAASGSASGAAPIVAPVDDASFDPQIVSNPERESISNPDNQIDQAEPPAALPAQTVEASDQEPVRTSARSGTAAAVVFALLLVAGLPAFLFRDRWLSKPQQKAPAAVAAFPLQLEVEAQGEGLNIRWNPQSMPVTQAREGRLAILESDQPSPRIVPLDLQQLAGGHIFYRPSTERVQFQLEIVDVSGSISKESVLALTSTAAPAIPPVAPPHAGSMQNPAAQVRSIPIPNANTPPPLANTTEAPPKAQPAPRTFTAPPSNRDRIGQVPVIALDQPPTISANTVLPTTVALPATLNNLPPPQAQELPPVKEPLATKRIKVGSLQAANLIKRVTPVYPPMAAAMHIQGTVRFAATIGKDGTVRNLQLISGNAALVKSATDAVKQWIYRPTLLNGDPVEVLTQITVDFALRP